MLALSHTTHTEVELMSQDYKCMYGMENRFCVYFADAPVTKNNNNNI